MFTNAQVARTLAAIDARLASIEAILASDAGTPVVGTPVTLAAASPLVIPDKAVAAKAGPRYACTKHPAHKDGKGFTVNGRAAHAAWCDGVWSEIASA